MSASPGLIDPYSEKARELARNGIIDGKPLGEWLNAPFGKFAEAVRDKVDPFFGLANDSEAKPRVWSVKVRYSYVPEPETEYASTVYEIEAVTAEEAAEKAEEMFGDDTDLERGDNHEIEEVCEPRIAE